MSTKRPQVTIDENGVPHPEGGERWGGPVAELPADRTTWVWLYRNRPGTRRPLRVTVTRWPIGRHYYVRITPAADLVWNGEAWQRPWFKGAVVDPDEVHFNPPAVEPDYENGDNGKYLSRSAAKRWIARTLAAQFPPDRYYVTYEGLGQADEEDFQP